jgi:hypothetical protein
MITPGGEKGFVSKMVDERIEAYVWPGSHR